LSNLVTLDSEGKGKEKETVFASSAEAKDFMTADTSGP
jgi:hypothetical protein